MEARNHYRLSGPELFASYAQPPNLLGYCGPPDQTLVVALADETLSRQEVNRIAQGFEGAWPYLELIAAHSHADPLDVKVVESYWIGNDLLGVIDRLDWGNSLSDRFRTQAGRRWEAIVESINRGGVPNHAFHVFCVYPWVGLLRQGFVNPSLEVLDRCQVSWGTVVERANATVMVRRRPLVWRDNLLQAGELRVETFQVVSELGLAGGDVVSLHWDSACQRLDQSALTQLRRVRDRHLAVANHALAAARLMPS